MSEKKSPVKGSDSIALLISGTFKARGFEITPEQAAKAASVISNAVVWASMASNPRDWCLSCGTISGNGECHCTDARDVDSCVRRAVNYFDEKADDYEKELTRLREQNARLKEALEPSHGTKAAYMSEFTFPYSYRDENGEERAHEMNVPWRTIKEIMAAIRARAAHKGAE